MNTLHAQAITFLEHVFYSVCFSCLMESAEMLLPSLFICRFSEIETEEQEDLLFRKVSLSMKKQSYYTFINNLRPHKK
jgi:hypothetical protein